MINPADPSLPLLRALVEIARELPPSALGALATALQAGGVGQSLARFAATQPMKAKLRMLEELHAQQPAINGQSLAFALEAAAQLAEIVAVEQGAEIAWTGPATEAVPLRRVDQVVYDMVETARVEILLVSYAAYKAERALKALRDAADRGVHVKLVIELAAESGGKITFDSLPAFRDRLPHAGIYYWPRELRRTDASGSYGAMHAKALVVDRGVALVSSANLTTNALETNIELGVVVRGSIASRLAMHFDQLIARGTLVPVS